MAAVVSRNKGFFQTPSKTSKPPSAAAVPEKTSQTPKNFFKTGQNEETGGSALLGLFVYSLVLLFLPLFVYFAAKQILEESFDWSPPNRWNISSSSSIVTY